MSAAGLAELREVGDWLNRQFPGACYPDGDRVLAAADLVARSRFVADYWRRHLLDLGQPFSIGAHALCMVLAALDGETDPARLGVGDDGLVGLAEAVAA